MSIFTALVFTLFASTQPQYAWAETGQTSAPPQDVAGVNDLAALHEKAGRIDEAEQTYILQDWTPDGATVLFTQWNFQSPNAVSLWRVSTGGDEPESLGLAREALRDVSVNPSGSRITFTAGNPRAEIWALENLLTRSQPKL